MSNRGVNELSTAERRAFLRAFWHGARRCWVPLTGPEWRGRCGIQPADIAELRRCGDILALGPPDRRSYEISPAGVALLGVRVAA
ncbi:hypothetical protein SAMN05421774_11237 [Gemmobacter megaterium]|uniref:Uncharacterized protein n=1 Tax=Gemmobacter megaterium TaxID=1086013 RepID=A0A1N7QIF7_9RHOB|nr:hypothetical protein [Gemmobacter megaterium]GGE26736.1 hypothetical protein GCM10011345_35910 [Gemmobacter megaterium]SIT22662.1 hypothetical protein SAMN05421774_11237 [Gemmobacter megaterium]